MCILSQATIREQDQSWSDLPELLLCSSAYGFVARKLKLINSITEEDIGLTGLRAKRATLVVSGAGRVCQRCLAGAVQCGFAALPTGSLVGKGRLQGTGKPARADGNHDQLTFVTVSHSECTQLPSTCSCPTLSAQPEQLEPVTSNP